MPTVRVASQPNRPHISSDIYQCQRAGKQNQPVAPNLVAPLANLISVFSFAFSRLRFRPLHRRAVFRFGEALFTDHTQNPQGPFLKKIDRSSTFFVRPLVSWALRRAASGRFLRRARGRKRRRNNISQIRGMFGRFLASFRWVSARRGGIAPCPARNHRPESPP